MKALDFCFLINLSAFIASPAEPFSSKAALSFHGLSFEEKVG